MKLIMQTVKLSYSAKFSGVLTSLFLSFLFSSSAAFAETSQADFKIWLNEFKQEAVTAGIKTATVNQAFANVSLNEDVLLSDKSQPEFTQTFFQYFDRAVSDYRIRTGQRRYKQHRRLLDQVTRKYGVPGRFLVAFWGLETNFGSYTGNIPIFESLATLAYDPRRSGFFRGQLMDALKILDKGHVSLRQMKGSWAGAMGQCQFMPSNYIHYAVDGDGDGKIDLWNSLPDVFYSAGNFLSQLGWQRVENWGREVALPKDFDYALADNKTQRSLAEWQKLGLKLADGRPLPIEEMQAKLLLATDYQGPAFLVFDNFRVIKRWNNADKYALAVGHLADRIIGRAPLTKQRPADDEPLSTKLVKEVQIRLNNLGYQTGKPDGVIGKRTRQALREFQVKNKIPADGYVNEAMLKILRQADKSAVNLEEA
ncbi:lytic murein transglycosylase [Thiomicrorhabdus sediminis]|nr:lytic murein transglycosylase [Thiomicrorhabdus sediminis]